MCELDLSPIKIASVESILFDESLGGFPIPLEVLDIIVAGRGEVGTTFNSLSKSF